MIYVEAASKCYFAVEYYSHFTLVFSETKAKPGSQDWLIAAGAYPGFCSMKRLEVFLLPLDGMLVHAHYRSLPRMGSEPP